MLQSAIFAQAPEDVLDVDDGVIDQFADGDGDAAKGHGVDGQTGKIEHDRGRQDRHRDRGQRDRRGPPVHQEQEQHDGDDRAGLEQDPLDIADRGLDEIGLAEDDLVGLHARRQRGRDFLQRLLDLARQPDRIDVGLLLDRDDDGGLAHIAGVAALDLGRELDGGNLLQIDRPAIDLRHHHAAKVVQIGGPSDVADQIFARMLIGKSAAGIDAELVQGQFDLLVGDAEAAQRRRIGRDPVLPDLAAHRNHLRDAGDRQQPRPHHEIGGLADLHRRSPVAGHRDQQHLAHDGVDRPQLRNGVGRQLGPDQIEAFGDLLPVTIDIGTPVEFDIDDRKADAGNRADPRHAGNAVHLGFDRKADELFDLGRRKPVRLGHDRDRRLVQVGKHVHRQPAGAEDAEQHQHQRGRHDQQAVAQRLGDEKAKHLSCSSAHLVEQFGALHDEALASGEARGDEHAVAVERLHPYRTLFETLGRDVFVDDLLAVGVAHQAGPRHRKADLFLVGGGKHRDELPGAKAGMVALNGELNRNRLIAVRKAGALIDQRDDAIGPEIGRRAANAGQRIEAAGFDPQTGRIDDVENHRIGLGDLSGHRRAFGDDTVDRSHQRFGLTARPVERSAAVLQSLQLRPRVFELGAGNGAARHQRFIAGEPALHDGNLLVEFALALAHIRDVDGLHRRLDISEHVAFLDRRPQPRKSARRRREAAARPKPARSRWRSDRG